MEIEYKQWYFISTELHKEIGRILHLDTHEKRYEGQNVFNHWLLLVNQDRTIKKYKYFPILPELRICNSDLPEIALKLVNSIKNKKRDFPKLNENESRNVVIDILKYIEIKHDAYKLESMSSNSSIKNEALQLQKFNISKCPNLPYLLQKTGHNSWNITDIMMMMLRYESLGNGGYQWSLQKEIYTCYYNDYGVRYEGFASPFNSSFLGLGDCGFCSLFPDTDSAFGSMGNFFNVNLADYPGSWVVNPPFIEDILERASIQVIEALDAGVESTFFFTLPNWKDSVSWINLNTSKHTVAKRQGLKSLQDAYANSFSVDFRVTIFCLSYLHDTNLRKLDLVLKKTSEDGRRITEKIIK